jgi:hypothetical protein
MLQREKLLLISIVLLMILVGVLSFINKNDEKTQEPLSQKLDNARITVTAPPMTRYPDREYIIKELNKKISEIYFYVSKYKNIDYTLAYVQCGGTANFESAVNTIADNLKDCNFIYEESARDIENTNNILLEGTFEINEEKYGIKSLMMKKGNDFWQATVVFPYCSQNEVIAKNFIDSIQF